MSAIGDCILTLPLLCALRRARPDAFLAWAVEERAAALLAGHPCLDRLIVLRRGWFVRPWRVAAVARDLRRLDFDVAIDPQSITKTALAGRLSGAPRRIGFTGEYGRELSVWLNNELVTHRAPHLVDRTLELLQPLGIDRPQVEFRLPVTASGRAATAELRRGSMTGDFALINPGASWRSKRWLPSRFAEVARHLGEVHGLPSLIVWASAEERVWAESIVADGGGQAVLAPPTDLLQLAGLAEAARLFVGSDTGPLHLAAALGTPCVALYGATRPADCGPYGDGHAVIQESYHAGSRSERRQASDAAMRAIAVERVTEACDRLLRCRPDRVAVQRT